MYLQDERAAKSSGGGTRRAYRPKPGRLHRTLSDESMCGAKSAYKSRTVDNLTGNDVIFTTAVPAQVVPPKPPPRKGEDKEQR